MAPHASRSDSGCPGKLRRSSLQHIKRECPATQLLRRALSRSIYTGTGSIKTTTSLFPDAQGVPSRSRCCVDDLDRNDHRGRTKSYSYLHLRVLTTLRRSLPERQPAHEGWSGKPSARTRGSPLVWADFRMSDACVRAERSQGRCADSARINSSRCPIGTASRLTASRSKVGLFTRRARRWTDWPTSRSAASTHGASISNTSERLA
jgi:hypothetical protein